MRKAKLLYYNRPVNCSYPTGEHFTGNLDYIYSVVEVISKMYGKEHGTLHLVGNGRSGNILSGAVATKLVERGQNVIIHGFPISIHENSPSCISSSTSPIILIDDFISTGDTILELIQKALSITLAPRDRLNMLCISNALDAKGGDLGNTYETISGLFDYICGNDSEQLRL